MRRRIKPPVGPDDPVLFVKVQAQIHVGRIQMLAALEQPNEIQDVGHQVVGQENEAVLELNESRRQTIEKEADLELNERANENEVDLELNELHREVSLNLDTVAAVAPKQSDAPVVQALLAEPAKPQSHKISSGYKLHQLHNFECQPLTLADANRMIV